MSAGHATLRTEASEWLVRLLDRNPPSSDPDSDPVARAAAFTEWVTRSDAHEEAFLRVCESYKQTPNLDPLREIDVEVLLAEHHKQESRSVARWPRWVVPTSIACTLLLALALLLFSRQPSIPSAANGAGYLAAAETVWEHVRNPFSAAPKYPTVEGRLTTQMGEHRCDDLPDKSRICLNTRSAVHYVFNQQSRSVELTAGEASFTVARQDRPFDVRSGGIVVRDLSTSFDVYKRHNSTRVTVIRGRIEIARATGPRKDTFRFHETQQVEYVEQADTLYLQPPVTGERMTQLLAWQSGYIRFSDTTLGEALEEFARYQPVSHFRFSDPSLAEIRIGGEFRLNDLDGFLAALSHGFHVHHTKSGTGEAAVITLSRH